MNLREIRLGWWDIMSNGYPYIPIIKDVSESESESTETEVK